MATNDLIARDAVICQAALDHVPAEGRNAYAAAMARIATPRLTRALAQAVTQQPPPRSGAIRPKPRYAHQGGINPPRIIVHGNGLERVPEAYRRYLERFFRDAFQLQGTPLQVEFRSGPNPYARRRALRR